MAMPAYIGVNFVPTIHHDIYPAIDPTKSDLSQPSKVVLITGAGRGIGASIALRYAESGVACIIICSRTAAQLDSIEQAIHKTALGVRVRKFPLDICDAAEVSALAEMVTKEEGRLDILINNAGTSAPWVPLTVGDADVWWQTWDVHVRGTYLMIKALLPLMTETAKKEGTFVDIINTSSVGAHFTFPGASAYQISKMAMIRLSDFVNVEYGAQGVNCVAIHPGGVVTELSKNMPPALLANLKDKPDLCGGFCVWLTKGQRTWLGGRYASVGWDVEELEAKRAEIVEGDKLKMRMVV